MEEDIYKKIRRIQAKGIADELESYSFSQALNDVLRKALK